VIAAGMAATRRCGARLAVSAQLEHALQARVVIEQAKGMVAAELRMSVDEALDCIRQFTRATATCGSPTCAADIVARELSVERLRT
jgi:hypothetical protein